MAAAPRLIGTAEIDIDVKKVAPEDMQSPPYKARVDFYIVYYCPADHSELKRALYPANFVLIFKTEAPNACPRFLADGPVEADCQLFHSGIDDLQKGKRELAEKANSFFTKQKNWLGGLDSNQDSQIQSPDPDHPRNPDKPLKR